MAKRQVFFSFHYANDNWRVAQIRNMGIVEDQDLFSDNSWEKVRLQSDVAIKAWIDSQLSMRSCVVVSGFNTKLKRAGDAEKVLSVFIFIS